MRAETDAIKRQSWRPVEPARPRTHPVHAERTHRELLGYFTFPDGIERTPRPRLARRTTANTGLHELRGRLEDHLRAAEDAADAARTRAEARVLRWAMRAAWWWLRRRARACL